MQKSSGATRPWFKERWFWILMTGPILVVIAGFVTFGIIVKGADDLVNDDYYKKGKDINLELKRDVVARDMGLNAQLMFNDDMSSVRVLLNSRQPIKGMPELLLLHPTRQQDDQTIPLSRLADNMYQGTLKPEQATHWYVRLQDKEGIWRLQGEWLPAEGNAIMLGTAKTVDQ